MAEPAVDIAAADTEQSLSRRRWSSGNAGWRP
jgi:hypothetical protein